MTPEQACAERDSVGVLHVVINHLRLREPVPDATVEAARKGMQLVVDAGALAARVAKADEMHLVLDSGRRGSHRARGWWTVDAREHQAAARRRHRAQRR
jgi:hypothetical protein